MNKRKEKYLRELYYNPENPASFSGADKLLHHIKKEGKYSFTKSQILKWLKSQEIHTTNLLVRPHRFKRKQVIAPYIDYQWDIDTAFFIDYTKENDGYGYFILAIDIMSRYIWTKAVKTPSGSETVKALKAFFKSDRKPDYLRSDQGTEFDNRLVNSFYKKHKITHFVTQNTEIKASYSERGIQSLKKRLSQYMKYKQTHRWIDQLENVTSAYNNSYHRSIKQTPASVKKTDEIRLWKMLYPHSKLLPHSERFKFNVKDVVRLSKIRRVFDRFYNEHWTSELFFVKTRRMEQFIPIYTLTDYAGDDISGSFYEPELQKVYVDQNTTYNIEKIVGERTINRRKEYEVKWVGWPVKFNSWVPARMMTYYSRK